MSKRTEMLADTLQRAISEIIQREIKDPRLGFVTITRVKVSPDMQHVAVYVSALGGKEDLQRSIQTLKRSVGFIKTQVARKVPMRVVPHYDFVGDDTARKAQRLEELMSQIRGGDDPGDENPGAQ